MILASIIFYGCKADQEELNSINIDGKIIPIEEIRIHAAGRPESDTILWFGIEIGTIDFNYPTIIENEDPDSFEDTTAWNLWFTGLSPITGQTLFNGDYFYDKYGWAGYDYSVDYMGDAIYGYYYERSGSFKAALASVAEISIRGDKSIYNIEFYFEPDTLRSKLDPKSISGKYEGPVEIIVYNGEK